MARPGEATNISRDYPPCFVQNVSITIKYIFVMIGIKKLGSAREIFDFG